MPEVNLLAIANRHAVLRPDEAEVFEDDLAYRQLIQVEVEETSDNHADELLRSFSKVKDFLSQSLGERATLALAVNLIRDENFSTQNLPRL